MDFSLRVNSFGDGETIPKRHTCEGADIPPALEWSNEPERTESFALIVDDPDAPAGTWNHWLLWDLPGHLHAIREGFQPGVAGVSGKNDFGKIGYGGPCPPKGHGTHRYYFTLFAIDRPVLGLPAGSKRTDLDRALRGRVLAQAQFMGRYART